LKRVRLSPRLSALASLVPAGSRLADIGTDHGRLPVWLLQNGQITSALAADIRPGPLESARRTAAEAGVFGIRFLLSDGLSCVAADEADTVVIAGMGGDNITEILRRAPWVRDGVLLLLQPMTKAEELRRCLPELGLAVQRETLAAEGSRLYQILSVRGGVSPVYSEGELYTGLLAQIVSDPLFPRRLEELICQTAAALAGMERAPSRDLDRLSRLRRAYADFLDMRKKVPFEAVSEAD
jgi:tRNA (adenine22-N1)-methyltransferase